MMDLLLEIGLSNAVVATVLALTAALIGWAARRPALTHALWLLVLFKLVTPAFYPVQVTWPTSLPTAKIPVAEPDSPIAPVADTASDAMHEEPGWLDADAALPIDDQGAPAAVQAAPPATPEEEQTPQLPWKETLLAGWVLGTALWFTLASVRLCRFQRLLRCARPAGQALQAQSQRLAARLGLRQCPETWLIPGRISPLVWALIGKPFLLLPRELLSRLTPEQLEALLVHELAHLRRRDHWVRVLEFVTTGLFWWHPVVWWARREIREAEEQCCDAWVVWALPGIVRSYALALVETVDFLAEARPALPPATTGIGYVHDLRRRMTMIMRGTTPRALTWSGGLVVLSVALFMLPILPTLAQSPAPGRPSPEEEVRRAEADEQQAAANLERARAQANQARQKRHRMDGDRDPNQEGTRKMARGTEVCLSCHVDPHAAANAKPGGEFDDLHAAVIHLSDEVKKQQEALRNTELRLHAAIRKLEEQTRPKEERGPRQPEVDRPRRGTGSGTPPEGGSSGGLGRMPGPGAGTGLPGGPGVGPTGPQGLSPDRPGLGHGRPVVPTADGGTPAASRGGNVPGGLTAPGSANPIDLERHNQEQIKQLSDQMERILMEMEQLKREMRERSKAKPPNEVGKPAEGSDKKGGAGPGQSDPSRH